MEGFNNDAKASQLHQWSLEKATKMGPNEVFLHEEYGCYKFQTSMPGDLKLLRLSDA